MCSNLCVCLTKCILSLINTILFIFGAILLLAAGFLTWSTNFVNRILDGLSLPDDVLTLDAINITMIVLYCIGGFIVVMAIFGFVSNCCNSRVIISIYLALLAILFLAHLSLFIFVIAKYPDALKSINKSIENSMNDINRKSIESAEKCAVMKHMSDSYKCCGLSGPADFLYEIDKSNCCADRSFKDGCSTKSTEILDSLFGVVFILPNSILLSIEFLAIFLAAYLIHRLNKRKIK